LNGRKRRFCFEYSGYPLDRRAMFAYQPTLSASNFGHSIIASFNGF
jgi:hypothetical protein